MSEYNIPTLKDCVTKPVKFKFFRNGSLYYECANGFSFEIPISETGDAVFLPEDKGIFFMRWIRKMLEELKQDLGVG